MNREFRNKPSSLKSFRLLTIAAALLLGAFSWSCQKQETATDYSSKETEPQIGDWVVIGIEANPSTLNPVNYLDETAENVSHHLYGRFLDRSAKAPFELIPQLATGRPEITGDGLRYRFQINPAARWDDGSPVVAEDALFSLKVYLNPYVNCPNKRHYFDSVDKAEIDPNKPKEITFVLKHKYLLAESSLGSDLVVINPKDYDPQNLMRDVPLETLTGDSAKRKPYEARLKQFAEVFNGDDFARNPAKLTGCGPYRLVEWKDQQQIVLERKSKWWGDSLARSNESLQAWPERLVYRMFGDPATAVAALKKQEIDVYSFIPPQLFKELEKDTETLKHYELSKTPSFTYSYLGMNLRPQSGRTPFFTDRRVRRAMAHLMQVDAIIEKMTSGLAGRIAGPVFPLHHGMYNDTLKPISFDPKKAAALLDEAGWNDSDGDGVRDKVIAGRKTPFRFDFLIIAGNEQRKNVALVFQQECRAVGVDFNLVPYEFSTYVQKQLSHEFDMYYGGWAFSPAPLDLKQVFHTSNWANMGSNDVGFGNVETDALLEEIRTELDTARSNHLYRKFQEIVYEEQPYVFLINQHSATAVHRRFRNAETSALRPNFQANAFWTPSEWIRYGSRRAR